MFFPWKLRRKRRRSADAALALLLLAFLSSSQPVSAQSVAPPTAGTTVSLCVPLHAKHTDQLSTLRPSDLALVDAGRPIDSREIQLSAAAPDQQPMVTFIFDRLRPASARSSARLAEKMVAAFSAHPLLLGVWSIDAELRVLQPYTVSKSAASKSFSLVSASNAKPRSPSSAATSPATASPVVDIPTDNSSASVFAEARRRIADQRGSPANSWTYTTLLAAAHVQRQRAGRKAIILFTEQPNLDGNAPDRYRELPQALRDANISLFVFDANALDDASSNQATLSIAMGGQSATNYYAGLATLHSTAPLAQSQGLAPLRFQAMKDTIATLEAGDAGDRAGLLAQAAQATGGAYVFADASTRKFTQRLLSGLDDYVTVTYSVASDQQDGHFHSVSVRSTRPDIAVAAQPGYFASRTTGPGGTVSAGNPGLALAEGDLAALEKDATDAALRLNVAALRFGPASFSTQSVLAVEVPLPQLHLQEDEHTRLFSLHATLALELLGAGGVPVARFQQECRRRGALEAEAGLGFQVFSLQRQLALPAGEYTLNATVRDWNAGTFGKATQHIVIPVGDSTAPISDLVVVRSLDHGGADATASALQYGDKQVVPSLSGRLTPDSAKASLYFQLYSPLQGTNASRAAGTLSLTLLKDGQPLATVPLKPEENHLDGIATHLFTVALNRGPGEYEVVLNLQQDTGMVTRRASLFLPPSAAIDAAGPSTPVAASGEPVDLAMAASRQIAFESDASPSSAPAPSAEQTAKLLAATRESALAYTDKLPNFICQETISRSSDHTGTGSWKTGDVIVESLHYQDKVELRTVLKINGDKSDLPADRIEGARSNGEFGTLLRAIFDPAAQAHFTWVRSDELNGDLLQVFRFQVAFENSRYTVTDRTNSQLRAAFHGLVVIDTATRAVRRIFFQTEGLPRDFGVKASWIAMNYDYVQINNHDYLLPSHGQMGLQQGKHEVLLNQIDFSQYRRFGARSRLLVPGAPDTLQ